MNRWFRVAGGVAMNLCFGSAYAFSIFLAPFQREFGWTRAEVSLAFTISIAFIAAAAVAFLLRSGSLYFGWQSPEPVDLTPVVTAVPKQVIRKSRRATGRRETPP